MCKSYFSDEFSSLTKNSTSSNEGSDEGSDNCFPTDYVLVNMTNHDSFNKNHSTNSKVLIKI